MEKKAVPSFLKDMLTNQYNSDSCDKILQGYTAERFTTLRVNTIKSNAHEVKKYLESNGIIFREVPWYENALIIENSRENTVRELEIYNQGKIYLQSLSSMIPPLVLEPKAGECILDMAAAPGGKTTEIAALSDNKAQITACEKNKIRAERLKYNIEKQGAHAFVMVSDARKLDDFFSFDKILLDAPCSGSGTICLFDEKLDKRISAELVERSAKTQQAMLNKAVKLLKPGHELVYSTCSVLEQENENIIRNALSKGNVELVPVERNFEGIPLLPTKLEGTLCVCPNELYEGFFIAKL
ncbi:MAG: RsmB/NOP family class I SAM-dependent RNA methyltransferase, partial [Oscillospiraceae bacterium]